MFSIEYETHTDSTYVHAVKTMNYRQKVPIEPQEENMPNNSVTNSAKFIAGLTVALIAASLWIFSSFLHYILVAAVLSLATSHGFNALLRWIDKSRLPEWIKKRRRVLAAFFLTSFFLMMIFLPLLYLIIQTSDLISTLNIELIKQTILAMWNNVFNYADSIPVLHEPLTRLKAEGSSLIDTSSIRTLLKGGENMVSGVSGLSHTDRLDSDVLFSL